VSNKQIASPEPLPEKAKGPDILSEASSKKIGKSKNSGDRSSLALSPAGSFIQKSPSAPPPSQVAPIQVTGPTDDEDLATRRIASHASDPGAPKRLGSRRSLDVGDSGGGDAHIQEIVNKRRASVNVGDAGSISRTDSGAGWLAIKAALSGEGDGGTTPLGRRRSASNMLATGGNGQNLDVVPGTPGNKSRRSSAGEIVGSKVAMSNAVMTKDILA
jgi:hypothetical protein